MGYILPSKSMLQLKNTEINEKVENVERW